MTFEEFATSCGLILPGIEYGRWVRVPTVDHPHSRNGAYKHMGDHAHVQNHATQTETVTWFAGKDNKINPAFARKIAAKAQREITQGRLDAERKAEYILSQCVLEQHAYLDYKGFPDMVGHVYHRAEHENLLVVPMKIGHKLSGVQMITRDGDKKFLFGQQSKGAEYAVGSGIDCWCEGYATGLSALVCMQSMKIKVRVHVCFSDSNMVYLARGKTGFVLADNDVSGAGLRAAQAIGLPYLISDIVGDDFNDSHKKLGTFQAGQWWKEFYIANRKNIK